MREESGMTLAGRGGLSPEAQLRGLKAKRLHEVMLRCPWHPRLGQKLAGCVDWEPIERAGLETGGHTEP